MTIFVFVSLSTKKDSIILREDDLGAIYSTYPKSFYPPQCARVNLTCCSRTFRQPPFFPCIGSRLHCSLLLLFSFGSRLKHPPFLWTLPPRSLTRSKYLQFLMDNVAMLSSILAEVTSQDVTPVSPIASTDMSVPEPSMLSHPTSSPRRSSTPTLTVTLASQTSLQVYSTHISTMSTLSPTRQGTNVLSTLIPTLAPYTTSQEHNTFTSLSSTQTPPTVSSSRSSDSAVIIGSSVGATVFLCFIAIVTLLCLRFRRRRFDTHGRLDSFEHPRPTVSTVNRTGMSKVLGGQRGYDRGQNHTRSESSDSATAVGAGDVGSISEIADISSGQRTAATYSPSVSDVRHEEDRSIIARRERSRELGKLYPVES